MKLSLTTKISILFSLLVVVVLFNFLILTKVENEVSKRNKWVLHTHKVIEETEKLLGSIRDAETGQRGFLITIDKNYLVPFQSGIAQSQSLFSTMRKLTVDNMEQQKRLDHIQDLLHEKISELEETVQLVQQDKKAEAIEIVVSDVGKNAMDNIRERLREFVSVEENLLKQRNAEYYQAKDNLKKLFYANVFVLIAIIVISCLYVQRTIVRPLVNMSKSIVNARHDLHGSEINIKSTHDEIRILISEFIQLLQEIRDQDRRKDDLISQLRIAINEVKTLQGIIPICSHCKEIRNDKGLWVRLENYIQDHSDALFSHSICDNCLEKYYPEK